ncbi:MAG TPA: hypothetical protein GXZ97_07320 [Hydrogenispora sp.]|jgi:phosphatidylglycerophosphate synthase|nr:hypothetical protein [Hydrogenispora sp.]
MVNWNSWLRRTVFAFLTLFLLAYLVPGLSAFTVTHLLMVSILSAFLATIGENVILADTSTQKSILFFAVSALTIYFYAFVFMRERLPVVSVLLVAGLVTVLDYFSQARVEADAEQGVTVEDNAEPNPEHQE